MHIPDGFLSTGTWMTTSAISAGGLFMMVKGAAKALKEKMVPLMGITAAFIFAAQMLNFPVVGGTSGHLLGGVLAAVLLGPLAGGLAIAIVLIVQCLIFQDGGLTALGANIFNMAIIGTIIPYYLYKMIRGMISGNRGILIGTAVAAWFSVVIASSACALELAISGTSPLNIALPAMLSVHVLIGIGEAIITTLVVSFILKTRSDLIYTPGEAI